MFALLIKSSVYSSYAIFPLTESTVYSQWTFELSLIKAPFAVFVSPLTYFIRLYHIINPYYAIFMVLAPFFVFLYSIEVTIHHKIIAMSRDKGFISYENNILYCLSQYLIYRITAATSNTLIRC